MTNEVKVFGIDPKVRRIVLTKNSVWRMTLRLRNMDWPDGHTVKIEFDGGVVWTAEITGPWARFFADTTDTNPMLQGTQWQLFVRDEDDKPSCWYLGTVRRMDRAA